MSDATKCQEACQGTIDCKYFTFSPSNQKCWLKSAKSNPTSNDDRISGAKCCWIKWITQGLSINDVT